MTRIYDYDHGISAIDALADQPLLNSIHLIVERGRAAIVDTAMNASVPAVLDALAAKGIARENVDWIILTHIHLDHAGGAGLLASMLPNARVTVHPRGARHMIDPSRLWASTVEVYGAETAERVYGRIVPIPAERVLEAHDGTTISLAGRELTFFDTPGHARHHVCVRDARTGHFFVGDTFGLSYRELDVGGRQFAFPSTSPTQWEPEAHHRSIDRVLAERPDAIYCTHFSRVRDLARIGADLHRLIDAHAELALRERGAGADREARIKASIENLVIEEHRRQGWTVPLAKALEVLGLDIGLNAQGLGVWLDGRAAASGKSDQAG